MRHGRAALGGLFLLSLTSAGCGDPCVALCEDFLVCPDADTSIDCEAACASAAADAESLGCTEQRDAVIDCEILADDVCLAADECPGKISELSSCVEAACEDDPTLEACQ